MCLYFLVFEEDVVVFLWDDNIFYNDRRLVVWVVKVDFKFVVFYFQGLRFYDNIYKIIGVAGVNEFEVIYFVLEKVVGSEGIVNDLSEWFLVLFGLLEINYSIWFNDYVRLCFFVQIGELDVQY